MTEDLDLFLEHFGVDAAFNTRTFRVITGAPVGTVPQTGVTAWDQSFEVKAKTQDLAEITEKTEITVQGTLYRVIYRADDGTGMSVLQLKPVE